MITHIERPILAMQLSKIFSSSVIDKSDQEIISSIIDEINKNKSGIDLDHDNRTALIDIFNKHMGAVSWN